MQIITKQIPVRVLQWNISLHNKKEQAQNLLDT